MPKIEERYKDKREAFISGINKGLKCGRISGVKEVLRTMKAKGIDEKTVSRIAASIPLEPRNRRRGKEGFKNIRLPKGE